MALTEEESDLTAAGDAAGLERVCDERAPLLEALGRPGTSADELRLVARFAVLRDANEAAARRRLDDLRRRLARLDGGRSAIGAYSPPTRADGGRQAQVLDREG